MFLYINDDDDDDKTKIFHRPSARKKILAEFNRIVKYYANKGKILPLSH